MAEDHSRHGDEPEPGHHHPGSADQPDATPPHGAAAPGPDEATPVRGEYRDGLPADTPEPGPDAPGSAAPGSGSGSGSVEPESAGSDLGETAETRAIHPPDDATAVQPAATDPWAHTAPPIPPADQGPRPVGPSGTTVMPAVPPSGPGPGAATGTPRWSARAQVPQAESDDTIAAGEGLYEEPRGRGLLTPVLIAVSVVVLLAAIGFGVWLVARGLQGVTPTPPVGPTRPTATTPPATSSKPAPSTTGTTPVAVLVPDLRGQDYAAAASTLTGLGLVPQRVNEPSTTVPAGKVIRTDSGGFVLAGSTIIVVVSSGSPTPSASPSQSPSPK